MIRCFFIYNLILINLQEDETLHLTARINYSTLDKGFNYKDEDRKCNELQRDLENRDGVKDFCIKLTGNLKNYDRLNIYGPFDNDTCTVLNFWMYNNFFNKITKDDDTQKIITFYSKLYKYWESAISREKCDIHTYLNVKANFNDLKKLYDYATNYESLKLYMAGKNNVCTENFKQYIDGMHELIKNAQSKCDSESHDYCFLLNYIKKKYTIQTLLELRCVIQGANTKAHVSQDQGTYATFTSSRSRSRNIAVVAFPILGTVFTFLMLYKVNNY